MRNRPSLLAAAAILTTLLPARGQSKDFLSNVILSLMGEYDIARKYSSASTPQDNALYNLQFTDKILTIRAVTPHGDSTMIEYRPSGDLKITAACFKADNENHVYVALSNGTVVLLSRLFPPGEVPYWQNYRPITGTLQNVQDMLGDALYALKSGKVWASIDSAKTWKLDTIGMYGETVSSLALDAKMNVWAVTQNRKLYSQHKDSSAGAWHNHPAFITGGFPTALFIDRMGRIVVASNISSSRVQVSADTGATWTNVTGGLSENIVSFADDKEGNLYGVGQISGAYRLSGLTPPWVPIHMGIAAQSQVPAAEKIISSLSFHDVLYATTRYGVYTSADSGAHWTHAPDTAQSHASTFYTPLIKAGGKYFLSTNLGVHRAKADLKSWEKVFPQGKYAWGINALAADDAGNLYGNVPVQIDTAVSRFYPVKSTDQGDHWDLDTAGQGLLKFNSQTLDQFVDRQGAQWLGGNGVLYCKKPDEAWKLDTAGLGIINGEYIRQVSRNNKKGIVYASLRRNNKYLIYKRAVAETAWQALSDTLTASDGILQSDQDGNLVVKVLSFPGKFWKYAGSGWTAIASPPYNPNQFAIDSEGTLWAALLGSTGQSEGLYRTTDNGATWKLAGLAGVPISFLSTDKDSVFAVTTGDGVFALTKSSEPIATRPHGVGMARLALSQNHPNPFKGLTRIRFALPAAGVVSLEVLDLRGQVVATLDHGMRGEGAHQVLWDAKGRIGGMYVCRLTFRAAGSGAVTAVRKILLLD